MTFARQIEESGRRLWNAWKAHLAVCQRCKLWSRGETELSDRCELGTIVCQAWHNVHVLTTEPSRWGIEIRPYEPPTVTPVGNLHDNLSMTCTTHHAGEEPGEPPR